MCGIAGYVLRSGEVMRRSSIVRASERMATRGPDDEGFFVGAEQGVLTRRDGLPDASRWGLIHRRLSILDLSEAGWQPMTAGAGKKTLVMNGEIYNYVELADELRSEGIEVTGSSDTEVALKAYLSWGADAFRRFKGMFAIAVVEEDLGRLILARDSLGIKPLFLAASTTGIFFASTSGAIVALMGELPAMNAAVAWNFLAYGSTTCGNLSYREGIGKVPPGVLQEYDLRSLKLVRELSFWTSSKPSVVHDMSFEDRAQALRDLYRFSSRLHVRSDTPVAISLSGGVDSTSLAGLIDESVPGSVKVAYTFQARDKSIDELHLASEVARMRNLELRRVELNKSQFEEMALDCISAHSEPFPGTSILAEYRIYQQCHADGFKVILTGQGPDEIFGGYSWFRRLRVALNLKKGKFARAHELAKSFSAWPDSRRAGISDWSAMALFPFLHLDDAIHDYRLRQLNFLKLRSAKSLPPVTFNRKSLEGCETINDVIRKLILFNGLQNQLFWSDQNSMRFSIESRVPFVLPEIVDFAATLPDHYLVDDDGLCKAVHRAAVSDLVPESILNVRRKIGFETDEEELLKECPGLIEEALRCLPELEAIGLNSAVAVSYIKKWQSGESGSTGLAWRLIALSLWNRSENRS